MTVHKLTAGDGYTYLTRQVASADERRQGQALTDYYVAKGNPPGVWLGHGAAQLGLEGTEVSEAQMRSLFGQGRHPDAEAMAQAGVTQGSSRLGAAYPDYAELKPYVERVAQAVTDFELTHGRAATDGEHARLAATEARRGRRAVAGFDLVFTPVKSVSLLWALGGDEVRAEVEAAHHAAVRSALGWIETHAAYSRTGHGGIAQIDTTGLLAVAFDHRESRSGDPDLHTHVAVANKVCGVDGKWRSLDARGLYALGVAASERYNTRLEDEMARRLGVEFHERPGGVAGKRPVREAVGVPTELIRHFSRRRMLIEHRYAELHAEYRQAHGREPGRSAQLHLAQQATLETREGKGPGRTLAEQITDWTNQAAQVLGQDAFRRLVDDCVGRAGEGSAFDDEAVGQVAKAVIHTTSSQRSTWSVWNIHAEVEREARGMRFATPQMREAFTNAVVATATGAQLSVRISEPELVAEVPALRRASDGQSVFMPHGADRFTSSEILLAEDRLVDAARSHDGPCVDEVVVEAALAIHESTNLITLDDGQRALVHGFASSPARVVVGIGPAGSGKTTAMRAFTQTWTSSGTGRVVPLATSSKAAQVLGNELQLRAENLHKFLHENRTRTPFTDSWFQLESGDVVLLDEAGMAGTLSLDELLSLATTAGATIRLLGDPAQLSAVELGGALELLEQEAGAVHLAELHRFTNPDEARATLALRAGDIEALDFYRTAERIISGSRDAMLETAYDGWKRDVRRGLTSVLIAAATTDVSALNLRARTERILSGQVDSEGAELHDGNLAGVGDWVVTRSNARSLRYSRSGRWVHNGDSWEVERRHDDGSLTVRHKENQGRIQLPAVYVADSVELAYAATIHRLQGVTTDSAHALITPSMTREGLYVSSTRGRQGTQWYVATEPALDLGCDTEPDAPRTVDEVLRAILGRSGAESSATRALAITVEQAEFLPSLIGKYEHARDRAATDSLRVAVEALPTDVGVRVLNESAAPLLARTLASAAGRGRTPADLLSAAFDLEPIDDVRSTALVLASRIDDVRKPAEAADPPLAPAPLPWLSRPDVGHPGWLPYLQQRADLIGRRAEELGGLSAAYREQYGVTDAEGLGAPPEPETRRERAYQMAIAAEAEPAQRDAAPSRPREPFPTRHQPSPRQRGPDLGR